MTVAPEGLPAIEPNSTGTITATITPSSEAVAGDYVVTFKAVSAENRPATAPHPLHGRDLADLGARGHRA